MTGPTGEIGKPFIDALERSPRVRRVIGMARRGFDPAARGWTKTEYREGDILDRESVDALVAGADVVVHLAFIIITGSDSGHEINLQGSRNVFEAAVAAGARRLVYTSSVAAYGFAQANGGLLTEDLPPQGSKRTPTRREKAEVEALLDATLAGSKTQAYVFRPCIVAGPEAPLLINSIPYVELGERMPSAVRALFEQVPVLKPVLPDTGVPFQLVHHDDVADALRRRDARQRIAGRLQPRRRGRDHDGRPGRARSAGTRCRSPSSRSTRRRRSSRGCRSCPTRPRGSRRCETRC